MNFQISDKIPWLFKTFQFPWLFQVFQKVATLYQEEEAGYLPPICPFHQLYASTIVPLHSPSNAIRSTKSQAPPQHMRPSTCRRANKKFQDESDICEWSWYEKVFSNLSLLVSRNNFHFFTLSTIGRAKKAFWKSVTHSDALEESDLLA